jgi:TatD DNase family protein
VYLIDTHCHIDDASFDGDRAETMARARAAGVGAQVVPAISARRWPDTRRICAEYEDLHPAYGLHPVYLHEHRDEHLNELASWLEREPAVAIGECGLDYYLQELDRERQQELFAAQLRLARETGLPLVIHARRSVDDIIKHIRRHPGTRGVIHSFAGSEQQARRLVDLGFVLGLGGTCTHERARRVRALIRDLPLECFVLETDAPDQPGAAHRGQRNEPGFLPEIVQTVARIRDEEAEHIAAVTTTTARSLFHLPH